MAKIKAIVKRTDEPVGHMTNISNTLKNLQKIVGGNIEVVALGKRALMICNEEGKYLGLPRNFTMGQWPCMDVIVGDIAIVGVDGEDFGDVPFDLSAWKTLLQNWGNDLK